MSTPYIPEPLPDFSDGYQGPEERNTHQVLVSIAQQNEEILTVLRHIEAKLGQGAQSSVELSENAKGAIQLSVKVYNESPVVGAGADAVVAFGVLKREIEQQQLRQWTDTIDSLGLTAKNGAEG